MLIEIENLFFYAGLLAFVFGVFELVISLFKRRQGFFKAGVIAMFLGDCAFAVAIAFPKKAQAILQDAGVESFPLPPLPSGIFLGILLILPGVLLFVRRRKVTVSKEQSPEQTVQTEQKTKGVKLENAGKTADPALFAKLRSDKAQAEASKVGSFSALD